MRRSTSRETPSGAVPFVQSTAIVATARTRSPGYPNHTERSPIADVVGPGRPRQTASGDGRLADGGEPGAPELVPKMYRV